MIKPYSQDEHEQLRKDWNESYGWPFIGHQFLPETGFVAYVNDKPACMGFLYKTDSKICILEWVLSDKKLDYKIRQEGINLVIEEAKRVAKTDFKAMLSFIKNERLLEKYESTGYNQTDHGMIHGMWSL